MSTFSKENTNEIFEDIKRNLSRGVKDRKHDFHTPVFSNINNQNSIESRVVVLRDFDVENMILNFHTDFRSPKVEDLAKNENSLFVFYDYKLKVQLWAFGGTKLNKMRLCFKFQALSIGSKLFY